MKILYRRQLVELIKYLDLPLVACECGVAEGNFSRDLLVDGLDILYSIDNWGRIAGQTGDGNFNDIWHLANYEKALEKLKPFGSKSIILKGMTSDMAKQIPDNSLGLAYFDGNHSYNGVMDDLNNYYSKVVKGGVIAGHDFLQPHYGVKSAVEEFCDNHDYEVHVIPENKDEDAGFWFVKK